MNKQQIVHFAMGTTITRSNNLAQYGDITNGGATDLDEWTVSTGSVGSNDSRSVGGYVLKDSLMRRYGEQELTLYSRIITEESGSGNFGHEVAIQIWNGTSLVTEDVTQYNSLGSGDPIEQTVDISSLSTTFPHRIEVIIRASITTGSTQGGTCKTGLTGPTLLRTGTGS